MVLQKIKISNKYCPFSHLPGAVTMIPGSPWAVQAYPTRIILFREQEKKVLDLCLSGPVKEFTLEQDLEQEEVHLFGRAKEGFFFFTIKHLGDKLICMLKRSIHLQVCIEGKEIKLAPKEEILFEAGIEKAQGGGRERLFLGFNKKLDIEKVTERFDLRELFPLYFLLGQMPLPQAKKVNIPLSKEGMEAFLLTKSSSVLMPKRCDTNYLGIKEEVIPSDIPLEAILSSLYEGIRSLFLQEEGEKIYLLPQVYKEFVSGRLVDLRIAGGLIDIEWTKGSLRKVRITAKEKKTLHLAFPKGVKSYRLKRHIKERGIQVERGVPLEVDSSHTYFLDRFLYF